MKRVISIAAMVLAVYACQGCRGGDSAQQDTDTTRVATPEMGLEIDPGEENVLQGSIMYELVKSIPSNSTVHLRLINMSADSLPTVATEQVFSTEGRQPPIPFSIPIKWEQLDSTKQYELRAEIIAVDGTVLYATEEGAPVLTHNNPEMVHLMLQPQSMQHPELPAEDDTGAIAP